MLHNSLFRPIAYLSLIFIFFAPQLLAQREAVPLTKDTLMVGIAGSAPFVFKKNTDIKGIAIEIWEELAHEKSWNFKFKYFETVDAVLQSLQDGDLDVAAGPLSITSQRLEFTSFSQHFYNSSLAILSRSDKLSFWEKVKPLFSIQLAMAVLLFLIILAIVGALLWMAERKKSPDQFPMKPIDGIATGMWLAVVTMSTTGYGDKAPITLWGRIIAGSWMVISIIFATSMVAGIASTLTLSSLGNSTVSNIEQLSKRKAATIIASPSEQFLKEYNIKTEGVANLNEAVAKLENKEVDAVVYDRPQLLHYIKNNGEEGLHIAKAEYFKQGYGFAFPLHSPLVYDVNRALLELAEDQEIERIINYYLEKDE